MKGRFNIYCRRLKH